MGSGLKKPQETNCKKEHIENQDQTSETLANQKQ